MSSTDENPQHCPASTRAGNLCKGKPTASGWCVAHDPQANEWRARGDSARSNANRAARLMPSALKPYVDQLGAVFGEVYEQRHEADADTARTLQNAARVMASVGATIGKLIAVGEFEERLRLLEQRASDEGLFAGRGGKAKGPVQWPTQAHG